MPIKECELPDGDGKGWKWGDSGTCYRDRADAEKQAAAAHANGYTGDEALALDSGSVRSIDPTSGHLHVSLTNISKANVCPYWGHEISQFRDLGLDPDRIYNLYRDPVELKKGAASFNGKPLQLIHKGQAADQHDRTVVIGSVHNVEFHAPYLQAELAVWDKEGIDFIESGERKELSCGYFYTADMTPGAINNEAYDGVMRNLVGNHISIVAEGRAGPDVYVGDSAITPIPETIPATTPAEDTKPVILSPFINKETLMANRAVHSRAALQASAALRAYLLPKMAADQTIDLIPVLKGVNAKNWGASKPKIKVALDTALEGKLAEGATLADLMDMLNIAVDASPDDDDDDDDDKKKKKAAEDKEEDKKEAEDEDDDDDKKKKAAEDGDDDESAMDEDDDDDDDDKKKPAFLRGKDKKRAKDSDMPESGKEPTIKKSAMDAAIKLAVDRATRDAAANATVQTMTRMRAIQEAERIVRPYIGELAVAQDSAEDVYRLCLDHAGIDLEGVPEAAFPAMVKMLPKPGDVAPVAKKKQAFDGAYMGDMLKRFPGVTALKQR